MVGGSKTGEEPSYIDRGEPFAVRVACDSHGFYFTVVGDHEYPFYPRAASLSPEPVTRVVVKGATAGVKFMTFVDEGQSAKSIVLFLLSIPNILSYNYLTWNVIISPIYSQATIPPFPWVSQSTSGVRPTTCSRTTTTIFLSPRLDVRTTGHSARSSGGLALTVIF